jgi:hydrogenase maturation factor
MAAWYIKTRAEFFEVLERTIATARQRAAASPLWAHASILAQLEAMRDWTKGGRAPLAEERARITMGFIAVREFEAEGEADGGSFLECLVQLAGYFEEWPAE